MARLLGVAGAHACRRRGPLLTAQGTGHCFHFLGWSLGDSQVSGGLGEWSLWKFLGSVFLWSLTCGRARRSGLLRPTPQSSCRGGGGGEGGLLLRRNRNSGAQDVAALSASLTSSRTGSVNSAGQLLARAYCGLIRVGLARRSEETQLLWSLPRSVASRSPVWLWSRPCCRLLTGTRPTDWRLWRAPTSRTHF